GVDVGWSSNNGKPHRGGTCFGDSGGPTFPTGDGKPSNDNVVLTVTSFGIDENCSAGGGGYRLDQPDDLAFLATFGLTPSTLVAEGWAVSTYRSNDERALRTSS